MEAVGVFLSPPAVLLAYAWNFAVLSSIQLTVRLIRAYSVTTTAVGALLLTLVTIPMTILFNVVLKNDMSWLLPTMVGIGAVGFLIAIRVLRFRRQRSTVVAAIGIGLLSAPWGALLVRPPA
jgi:hypothetical protein